MEKKFCHICGKEIDVTKEMGIVFGDDLMHASCVPNSSSPEEKRYRMIAPKKKETLWERFRSLGIRLFFH